MTFKFNSKNRLTVQYLKQLFENNCSKTVVESINSFKSLRLLLLYEI